MKFQREPSYNVIRTSEWVAKLLERGDIVALGKDQDSEPQAYLISPQLAEFIGIPKLLEEMVKNES